MKSVFVLCVILLDLTLISFPLFSQSMERQEPFRLEPKNLRGIHVEQAVRPYPAQYAVTQQVGATDTVYEDWVARYNGPGNDGDGGYSMVVDGNGNVYVTGLSWTGANGKYATIKYDAFGSEMWVALYSGPVGDYYGETSIAVDGNGNVFVTGGSSGSGTDIDYATIKYNPSGGEEWVARYNGPGNGHDDASFVAADGEGNVYVTGLSWSGTSYDFVTIKYDTYGIETWLARYNSPGDLYDDAQYLAIDNDGSVYVTGHSDFDNWDILTVKYDASGNLLWAARYDYGEDQGWGGLAVDGNGNVYVTGTSNNDYATIKYDASGDELWVARYNGSANGRDSPHALAVNGEGNVYVTGESWGSGTGDDYATIKYDSSGLQEWVARYNGPVNSDDEAYSLAIDGEGNVYVTGPSRGAGFADDDYTTIKYDPSGGQEWVARYNGPNNDFDTPQALAVDGEGNVYVTGWSFGFGTSWDFATIKYSQRPTTVVPHGQLLPADFALHQNFPNPFNPLTSIKYDLPVNASVSLKIYDMLGREVLSLIDGFEAAGYHQTTVNAANLASGVYFYRIRAGSFTDVKKLLLLK